MELMGRFAGAPFVMLGITSEGTTKVVRTGQQDVAQDMEDWAIGAGNLASLPIGLVANIERDDAFRRHPFRKFAPYAQGFWYIPLQLLSSGGTVGIFIVDPRLTINSDLAANLLEFAALIRDVLDAQEASAAVPLLGMCDQPQKAAPPIDLPSACFLFDTLVKKRVLRSRGETSYVTLRSWRAPIKLHQLHMLKLLKAEPPDTFVDAVADEIATSVDNLLGGGDLEGIVPVPCGHSRREDCLSVRLARMVAEKRGTAFLPAFRSIPRTGNSHPRRNTHMPELVLDTPVTGRILLLDDVATTGTHLDAAATALRQTARQVVAMAWIGG